MKAGVALGSNLGDRLQNLRAARAALLKLPGVTSLLLSSPIYETAPIDCEPGATSFFNATVEFDYEGEPIELWRALKQIEGKLGRPGQHERNVSRSIDLDLLYFGGLKMDRPELQLPHPRMHDRRFVLQPLANIRPDLILPNQNKTVRELLASLDQSDKVERIVSAWD